MPIKITRFGPLVSKFSEIAVGKAVRESFDALGSRLVTLLQADAPNDTGKFKKSIRHKITRTGLNTALTVYSNAKNAQYAEEGRRPGKQPPPDVMLRLVRRKGLGARAFSVKTRRQISAGTRRIRERSTGTLRTRAKSLAVIQRSIAFLIGKSIGRKGTKGSFIFRDLERNHAAVINQAYRQMEARIVKVLNG